MAGRDEANSTAIERVLACAPRLVGLKPAGEVVPGLARNHVLHAAPPIEWETMSALLRSGMTGAALFEGLARTPEEAHQKAMSGAIRFGAAQDHGATAGGIGSISASLPVLVVEDAATGDRAFHPIMEGFGKTLILGMYDEEVFDRLRWFRDELAPALDRAIEAVGGIDVDAIMVEALRRGDELHNRNAAATSMLAERLAVGFARTGASQGLVERTLGFVAENPQFFVPVSLARARLALAAGHGIEGSSLLTAVGANGHSTGIKVSGLGDRWFTAPAEIPEGVFLPGFGPSDAGPACGDSLVVECAGLGASVLPASPALWALVGADEGRAKRIFEETTEISLGEHPRYRVPALADRGAPTGIDVIKVVETGIRPVIDIVMVHPDPGRGVIGFGLTSPPMACFEQAAAAL